MRNVPLLLLAALGACTGELRELAPPDMVDGGGAGGGDLAGGGGNKDLGGDAAGNGPDLAMPAKVKFDPNIQGDLNAMGCAQQACHGGGLISMMLVENPGNANDIAMNYGEVKQRGSSGAMSLLLTKNLKGSGQSHGGGMPFASNMDATYVKWLAWINDGAPQ